MNYEAPSCAVCLLDLSQNLSTIPCGHVFHNECIIQCQLNGNKVCPFCRSKFTQKNIHPIQFVLTETKKFDQLVGLSESESNDIEKVKEKLENSAKEIFSYQVKVKQLEESFNLKVRKLDESQKEVIGLQEHVKIIEDKFCSITRRLHEETADKEKYKNLFSADHVKLLQAEDKLAKLESIEKLINEIQDRHSSVLWANSARESLPLEDQASQFYSALLISTTHLRTVETEYKQLKEQIRALNDEIQAVKRANSALRKENERLFSVSHENHAETSKRTPAQAGIEIAEVKKEIKPGFLDFNMIVAESSITAPKKTLSLLGRRK